MAFEVGLWHELCSGRRCFCLLTLCCPGLVYVWKPATLQLCEMRAAWQVWDTDHQRESSVCLQKRFQSCAGLQGKVQDKHEPL